MSLQSVTLGDDDADLVLEDGFVLSTTRRDRLQGSLAIADGRIAGMPEDPEAVIGSETDVIDLGGRTVAPGFIDAHTHLDLHQSVDRSYPESIAGGTTAMVSEVAAFGPAHGAAGVEAFLDSTADLPVRVFVSVPPQPFFDLFEPPRATESDRTALLSLLDRDRVVGVGETAWVRLVGRSSGAAPLYERAESLEKTVSGHGAGVSGAKLQALGTVITDDHEAITADGIRDRVTAGIHAIGRYGSIRDDLGALVDAATDIDSSELSLSTDGMWPRELAAEGHMDAVVRRAIEGGVDPVEAIVMATRTPARHFGLDGLGSLSPGSPADLVVLADLESVDVSHTIVGGEVLVGGAGPVESDPGGYDFPDWMTALPERTFDRDDFRVTDPGAGEPVRAIAYDGGLLTGEATVNPERSNGELRPDPSADVLKLSLHDRTTDKNRGGFTGFVQGFGIDSGAVATTLTWETPGILVLGADEAAMVHAANRVWELHGGWAVVEQGVVLADLASPIGATCAETPPAQTAEQYDAVESAVMDVGATVDRPLLGLQTIAFFGVPALKMAFSGYADIRSGEIVGLSFQ